MKGILLFKLSENIKPLICRSISGLNGTLVTLSSKSKVSYNEVSCWVNKANTSSKSGILGLIYLL